MDLSEKDKFDIEKKDEDPLNYHSSNISSDWQFGAANHSSQSMGLEAMNDSIAQGKGFLHSADDIIPQTLSEFPADSDFIERAARFSCFSDIVNSFHISESMKPYSKDGIAVHNPFEIQSANGFKAKLGVQSPMNEQNMNEGSHDVKASVEQRAAEGSSIKEGVVGVAKAHDDTSKDCHVAFEAEDSGSRPQVEPSMLEAGSIPSASNGHTVKKRKRISQVTEIERSGRVPQPQGETTKDDKEPKQKNVQNLSTTSKATKHGKDSSKNSDAAKEDYIHVRARRGQATNSHSLAERVRREKISERMKFLQDLVPGCNKVTGKAVMLDEIINYVQSLQRQVEFLSMKLATVNPRLDLNTEGLLAKDVHQSRGGPSIFPFPPDANMVHTQLHPSQQGLIQAGIPGTGNPLDALRRATNSQLMAMNGIEYKDSSQIPNMWDDELNNVFPVNFGTNDPFDGQDLNGSLPSGHMKVEP